MKSETGQYRAQGYVEGGFYEPPDGDTARIDSGDQLFAAARLLIPGRRGPSTACRLLTNAVIPAHGCPACIDLLHRDAVIDRANQCAQIAADAFLLQNAWHVNAKSVRIFLL